MSKEEVLAAGKDQFAADQAAALDKALGAAYDAGFAAVPVVTGDDADEQAKIDAAVAQAVGPLNDQIAALKAQGSAPAPEDVTPFDQADIDAAVAKVTDADASEMKELKEKLALDDKQLADVKASFKKQVQAIIDSLGSDSSEPVPTPAAPVEQPAPPAPVDQPEQM